MSWIVSILSAILKVLVEFFWTHPNETTTTTVNTDDRHDDVTAQLDELRKQEGDHPNS